MTNSNWSKEKDDDKKKNELSKKKASLRTAPNVDGFATSSSFNKGGVAAKRINLKQKRKGNKNTSIEEDINAIYPATAGTFDIRPNFKDIREQELEDFANSGSPMGGSTLPKGIL